MSLSTSAGVSTSHEVTIPSGDSTLRGTLTLPHGAGPHPAALLIVGSGPINRDSDHRRLALGVTRRLAQALVGVGVASLRFDKRGVGASDGDYWSTGFNDNIADARAALSVLRSGERIDAAGLMIVGHSEGAFIAAALGADEDLAGVALLAGAARTGAATLRWQTDVVVATLPRSVRAVLRLLHVDVHAKQAKAHERLRSASGDTIRLGLRRYNARWFREFLDFDPVPLLRRTQAPVFALTGGKDIQAPPKDVAVIGDAVAGPSEGHVPDDVNHILRHTPGAPSLRAYRQQVGQPLDPRVTQLLSAWASRVGSAGARRRV